MCRATHLTAIAALSLAWPLAARGQWNGAYDPPPSGYGAGGIVRDSAVRPAQYSAGRQPQAIAPDPYQTRPYGAAPLPRAAGTPAYPAANGTGEYVQSAGPEFGQPAQQPPAGLLSPPGPSIGQGNAAFGPAGANGVPDLGGQPLGPDAWMNSPAQPPDRYIDPDIYVTETQTGRIMFGVGVNSDAGVVGSVVIDEQNFDWRRWPGGWEDFRNGTAFRGAGQRFRLEAAPGTQVHRYMVNFTEPYLFDTLISLNLSGFFYTRRFRDWDEERLGGRVGLGYQLTPNLTTSVSFGAQNVDISNPRVPTPPEVAAVVGSNSLYGVRVAAAHDTRDNTFLATEGHLIELGFEQNFGDFTFPRATVDMRQYFLLTERPDRSGRQTLSLIGRLGVSGEDTPVFEHFFAGGFSTMRGFAFRGVGPLTDNVAVGGEFQLLTSIEYMFPITADDMLRGVVFADAGTVERQVAIHNYRVAPGFGLRITIPAMGPAPIAFDFAFPVVEGPGDRTQVFSFFVGFSR